jgi:hypothetical protein
MDEITIVALKNGQMMIGKLETEIEAGDNEDAVLIQKLISPRTILMTGPGQIQLLEIFGAPDYIELVELPIYTGPVTDKEMIRGYVEGTTSLVLPN